MVRSSLRRAFVVLRLIIVAGIVNLSIFSVPGGIFVPAAAAAAEAEQPSHFAKVARKSHLADPGDDDEEESSSDDNDDDDDDADDDCDDDHEDD